MNSPLRLLLVSGMLVVGGFAQAQENPPAETEAAEPGERPMKEHLASWGRDYVTKVKPDRRIEDIPPEELALVEPAPPEKPTPPPNPQPAPESARAGEDRSVMMDPVIVEGRRETPLGRQLRAHDREYAKTEKRTEPTALDSVLNHPWISLFGPYTAQNRAAMARFEMRIMNMERQLLIAISVAESEAEKRQLQSMLNELRAMRRW
jgi:hypothetical protein